jgi:molybdopterin-guanine dinucleotide biosynthesis protein A
MGRDKALIEIGGRALIEHALAALDGVCGEVLLACGSAPRYEHLGRRLVLDLRPGGATELGPLAGLAAALEATRTEWLIALACDMPGAEPELLEELARIAAAGELDVAMLATEAGPEPLCAVYRRTCSWAAREALERGEMRLTAFHGGRTSPAADARALRVATLRADDLSPRLRARLSRAVRNLNTPADVLSVERASLEPGALDPQSGDGADESDAAQAPSDLRALRS